MRLLPRLLRCGAAALVAAAPLLVVPAAAARDLRPAAAEYPAWFAGPVAIPNGVAAVGYAPRYDSLGSSFAEAYEDAAQALARSAHTRMRIERAVQTIGTETDLGGEFVQEEGTEAGDLAPVRLDSTVVGDMVLMLVATRRPPEALPAGTVAIDDRPPAAELRAGAVTATGVAPLYLYEHSSWREAEARARRALAFTVSASQRSLRRSADGDEAGVAVIGANVELVGIQVLARWRSAAGVHVMIRARAGRPLASSDAP